jgi:hypothetical protein
MRGWLAVAFGEVRRLSIGLVRVLSAGLTQDTKFGAHFWRSVGDEVHRSQWACRARGDGSVAPDATWLDAAWFRWRALDGARRSGRAAVTCCLAGAGSWR